MGSKGLIPETLRVQLYRSWTTERRRRVHAVAVHLGLELRRVKTIPKGGPNGEDFVAARDSAGDGYEFYLTTRAGGEFWLLEAVRYVKDKGEGITVVPRAASVKLMALTDPPDWW